MTLARINAALRRKIPRLHSYTRQAINGIAIKWPWLPALPRKLNGQCIRVHPRFCITPLDVGPHMRTWLAKYLKGGDTFFDVGAYVGWYSIFAAQRVGKNGRIVAFEASPINAFYLDYHRHKNHLDQIKAVNTAVMERAGESVEFHLLNGGDSTSNSIQCGKDYLSSQANQTLTSVIVPTTNLDAYAQNYPPNLIKIDVEGAELLVLLGAKEIMTRIRPPIILATHPSWLPNGTKTADVFNFLNACEYKIYGTGGTPVTQLNFADYLCLPTEYRGAQSIPQKRS